MHSAKQSIHISKHLPEGARLQCTPVLRISELQILLASKSWHPKSITTVGAICWTYWYSALISQILRPKSYHRLGLIDIFCVCLGIDCNILEQIDAG